jgi:hypothetical protein
MYKFKSHNTGDLIMLEATAQHILDILGKTNTANRQGIIQPPEMPAAIAALEAAVAHEEAQHQQRVQEALAKGEEPPAAPDISLRQRCAPFITMLKRCQAQNESIVWGV